MDNEDIKLVKEAKKGDTHAFSMLYSLIYKEVYYYALSNLGNSDDAADVVSDAVLDAFRTIEQLRDEAAFKSWFYRILTAKINHKKTEYIKQREKIVTNELSEDIISENEKNAFESIEILDELNKLSENERVIFTLSEICGYTSEEISKITGINASTVRSHLMRGREKLKTRLTERIV